ncbi:hypothetical protein IFO69_10885 [Echinicola sp. CAU 1574]|uniref:Uncharacterized protein n=1 Tax=Echinicola arenosa TaxID=2774144 RepID=A0ABR9AKL7_9BACT|nr:hypothetical protein [Echinicola arenosa]MBD8489250.1 hypothetical protein [Echinicola arenosa]
MKPLSLFVLFLLTMLSACAQDQIANKDEQIKLAVKAAPEESRAEAMVYGYDTAGELVVLRTGTNEYICIGDDPNKDGISVSCYHKDLEPFMERGRALRKEGKDFKEIFDIREQEVKSGTLKMPNDGATLFVFSANQEDYDASTGEVKDGNFRYVVYIPYATVESTGLPLKPEAPGMPWIMDPGTHRAHIMITPPKNN